MTKWERVPLPLVTSLFFSLTLASTIRPSSAQGWGGGFWGNVASTLVETLEDANANNNDGGTTTTLSELIFEEASEVLEAVTDAVLVEALEEIFPWVLADFDTISLDASLQGPRSVGHVSYGGKFADARGISRLQLSAFEPVSVALEGDSLVGEVKINGYYEDDSSIEIDFEGEYNVTTGQENVGENSRALVNAVLSMQRLSIIGTMDFKARAQGSQYILNEVTFSSTLVEYDQVKVNLVSNVPVEVKRVLSTDLPLVIIDVLPQFLDTPDVSEGLNAVLGDMLPMTFDLPFQLPF